MTRGGISWECLFRLDNHLVVFMLPDETEIRAVHYEMTEDSGLVVTDGKNFRVEINEFVTGEPSPA